MSAKDIAVKEILQSLCMVNKVSFDELVSGTRKRAIADWRHIFLAAINDHFKNHNVLLSELQEEVAKAANCDRTSVIYFSRIAKDRSSIYPLYASKYYNSLELIMKLDNYLNN